MTSIALRKEVEQYVNKADEQFLRMVYAMSREYENSIIGYSIKNEPINKLGLKVRVKAASNRVKSGEYIAHKDVEKEIENW